jgi:hypothetical protein
MREGGEKTPLKGGSKAREGEKHGSKWWTKGKFPFAYPALGIGPLNLIRLISPERLETGR